MKEQSLQNSYGYGMATVCGTLMQADAAVTDVVDRVSAS